MESTMGLSRRFLNMIMSNRLPGVRSLLRIDLTLEHLFNPRAPPAVETRAESELPQGAQDNVISWSPAALGMESIRLPKPSFNFRASAASSNGLSPQWKIDCFPLVDCQVVSVDQSGRGVLLDADTRVAMTMPILDKPIGMPISLFVPNTDPNMENAHIGSSLFLLERVLKPEYSNCSSEHENKSDQFQVFTYQNIAPSAANQTKSWQCHLLPSPQFVRDSFNWDNRPEITSYAVVGDSSQICISMDGIGTYCLDTINHTWSQVGKWTLPFHGKVEYVPELKLWFGLSADKQHHLAAADLSTLEMDSQPQLVGAWKVLDPPDEWEECKDSQFVNLGSGRFCVARFFQTMMACNEADDESVFQSFSVLTGVDVVKDGNGGNGKVDLRLIPHRSRRVNSTDIEALF